MGDTLLDLRHGSISQVVAVPSVNLGVCRYRPECSMKASRRMIAHRVGPLSSVLRIPIGAAPAFPSRQALRVCASLASYFRNFVDRTFQDRCMSGTRASTLARSELVALLRR